MPNTVDVISFKVITDQLKYFSVLIVQIHQPAKHIMHNGLLALGDFCEI